MRLLKTTYKQLDMFEEQTLSLDFYAEDKVPATDKSTYCIGRPVYTNSVLAIAGINATGKTTVLRLLDFAINVACGRPLSNASGDKQLFLRMLHGLELSLIFEQSGHLYALCSQITPVVSQRASLSAGPFEFYEETLYRWRSSRMPQKALLSSVDAFLTGCDIQVRRSELSLSEKSFLSSDVSIAMSITGKDGRCIYQPAYDEHDGVNLWFEGADETLSVLDPSVNFLRREDDGNSCVIGFTSGSLIHTTRQGLESVLSSGTIKGLRFVESAVAVLAEGGYLLVDEIENHLNKQLVSVLIDLFQSSETNPNGATLVFTTHYPEILDHVHRKDNVYFLVRKGTSQRTKAVKYSDKVGRIENKKSEVFLSNYIGGTAPRYTDVQELRKLVEEAVSRA